MNGIGNYASSFSNRLTGLSGFDTESTIKSLMDAEKMPLTLLQQKRQVVEWRQAAYRDITTSLRGFKSTYFDVLTPATNMLSSNTIQAVAAKSSSDAYVTATASADADMMAHLVKVNKLATADTSISAAGISKAISGTVPDLNLSGKSFKVTLDGVTREIALADYSGSNPDIQTTLQAALNTEFGTGKIAVNYSSGNTAGGTLSFTTTGGAGKLSVASSATTDIATSLGIASDTSNRIKTSDTLADMSAHLGTAFTFDGDNVNFSINGKGFSFAKTTAFSTVMNAINTDGTANVRMTYDEATDKISIKAKQLGAGDNIKLTETTSNFFAALGINTANPVAPANEGTDASATIDGQTIVRSSNSFQLNGVSYTLNKEHDVAATGETISITQDVEGAIGKIKGFVEKFNAQLDLLNTKVTERYDRNYLPLTDAQKEVMKDTDITNWEARAKTGLLQNDSILSKISEEMRRALNDTVEGAGLTLRDIGLSSTSYLDKGKLTLDETKLRDALQNKPDQTQKLLNGVSADVPSYTRTLTASERTTRYNQSGVFQRLSDILEDNITTSRDANGKKGTLLEKAGIAGDMSVINNSIYTELKGYNERITTMLDSLEKKENAYYTKFTAMESALQKMSSQSSWLASQLGSGS